MLLSNKKRQDTRQDIVRERGEVLERVDNWNDEIVISLDLGEHL